MSVVGVDIGTSGVRAVAFSGSGRVVDAASRRLVLHRPAHERVELDPGELVDAVESAVATVAAEATARGDAPEAIALSVLGEAVLPVDAHGRPLAPIAVSMDARGGPAASALGARVGDDRYTSVTGQPLHGMFSAFKIAAGDESWQSAHAYRCVGDFLAERWTGRAGIDASQAARMGVLDVERGQWSDELLAAIAADAPWLRREALPEPLPGGTVIAPIGAAAAER
ncbi:MAG: FGGY family carbohydrate kinase, partial [Microbacterium sp.]|uniref:FGGY family carbohydrate kinase n=1 Tax=Microbacterium sp. TaxID=51671 RepID=UPI0039E337CF